MGIEIERKFLVTGDAWQKSPSVHFCQGYLNRDSKRTIRVRIFDGQAVLTVKSLTTKMTRAEFEYSIPLDDAQQMMDLCERPLIEKHRYLVPHAGMVWEVDEFLGENQGLVVAEIELESENQTIQIPDWVGEEVTNDPRYFNSNLSKNPFQSWST